MAKPCGHSSGALLSLVERLPPLVSPPAQLALLPFPIPLAWRNLSTPLPGTLVTLFTKDRISVEVQNPVVLGQGAGLSPPRGAGMSWMLSGSVGQGQGDKVLQEGSTFAETPPRLSTPLTVESQLSIAAPWLSLSLCAPEIHPEHSPRPPPPFPVSPGAIQGRMVGGQGGGSMFRPRCFCSQTWQSPAPAAPGLASTAQPVFMFPASAPRQPRTAQHRGNPLATTPLSWGI